MSEPEFLDMPWFLRRDPIEREEMRIKQQSELSEPKAELDRLVSGFVLDFKPSTEQPVYERESNNGDLGDTYLLVNPCDGYHLMQAHFDDETGEFEGFAEWGTFDFCGEDFYVAWAILPDQLKELHPIFVDH